MNEKQLSMISLVLDGFVTIPDSKEKLAEMLVTFSKLDGNQSLGDLDGYSINKIKNSAIGVIKSKAKLINGLELAYISAVKDKLIRNKRYTKWAADQLSAGVNDPFNEVLKLMISDSLIEVLDNKVRLV